MTLTIAYDLLVEICSDAMRRKYSKYIEFCLLDSSCLAWTYAWLNPPIFYTITLSNIYEVYVGSYMGILINLN